MEFVKITVVVLTIIGSIFVAYKMITNPKVNRSVAIIPDDPENDFPDTPPSEK